jgi:methionyl-tRNA synthetase
MANKFFITTAIDYTNDVVHIGHSYQKMLADVLARYHRQIGNNTNFLTGTDEHGQKVEKSAISKGIEPKKFVDQIAALDKDQWDSLNISYDRFFRTTDEDHLKFAQEIYLKSKAAGDIYLSKFEGLYCEGCEGYLEESELIDGHCPFHPNIIPLKISEENYFFKLSKYQKFLEELLAEGTTFVVPDNKRKEILSFVKQGLKDFSVSRPNVKWGIPVPDDPAHTIYVWFDALINYLTYGVEENCWPADVHVLGKDNAKFHAIYWPAMLKSAGYELPNTILVHDFISLNGQKISKSLGNVILPSDLTSKYGVDPIRYFFLRYGPLTNDVDIALEKITDVYNSDLANGLGNLVARVAKLCENYQITITAEHRTDANNENLFVLWIPDPTLEATYREYLENFKVNDALNLVWSKISELDRKIEENKPWNNTNPEDTNAFLKDNAVLWIRDIARLLQPFLPVTSTKILDQFNGPEIKSQSPLFPRIK